MRLSVWASAMPVIGVDDLARTTRFYTHGLGFSFVRGAASAAGGAPAFAHLRHGAVDLLAYEQGQGGTARRQVLLYVAVSDVETLSAELRIRRIRVSPVTTAGDAQFCDVEDPDGYLLRFGTVSDPILQALGSPASGGG